MLGCIFEPGEQSLVVNTRVSAAAATVVHDVLTDFATGQSRVLQHSANNLASLRFETLHSAHSQIHHHRQETPAFIAELHVVSEIQIRSRCSGLPSSRSTFGS